MEGNQSRRIDFVDLTKGVCIILVVMAHVGGAFEQLDTNSMLSCFRMPLYFFISGVFFKSYEGLFGFILRKINKLIIPFLFFYLSAFLMKYIVWKIAPGVFQLPVSWNELLVVFHGHDLIKFNPSIWFLLALFNCNILFYLIHFLREKHLPVMFAVTILIGCAGFYLGKLQIEFTEDTWKCLQENKRMRKVLVIGDDSYIGCKIKAWLDAFPSEYDVDIISSRENKWKEADYTKYGTVVNTAGIAHINNITENMKPLFYAINRDLPINIGKICKENGVKHFIHFSSMNVYGDCCDDLKIRKFEKPTSFYGDSKYQGDLGLKKLENENFKISYVRPPFVYGKGCKGNYNNVVKLALKVPFFPCYHNKKSMIYIDNLCEFIRKVIDTELDGVLTPQNKELVSTCDIIYEIAKVHGRKLPTSSIFNPFIWIAVKLSKKIRRGLGNDNYTLALSDYFNYSYCVVSFKNSIKNTES